MKNSHYILLFLSISILSCQNDSSEVPPSSGEPIRVSASINMPTLTRSAYNLGTPTFDKQFDAMIWASTTSCNFPYNHHSPNNGSNGIVGYHTTVNFQNGTYQLTRDDLYYPSDNSNVYFVGLYPNSGWVDDHDGGSNVSTSFTYTGKEDVMYAPQVTGHKNASTSPTHPSLHFFHLLTWLRVEVYVENDDVANTWGDLQSMTLHGMNTTLEIDVSSVPDVSSADFATRQGNIASKVSFSSPSSLHLWTTDDDTEFTGQSYRLTSSPTEIAYVLCQPVNATAGTDGNRTNEYVLQLSTANRTGITVNVDLKTAEGTWFEGSTMGRQFIITLRFTESGYVSASASVTDWITGGYIQTDVTE